MRAVVVFGPLRTHERGEVMANHLTPEEVADEFGLETGEVYTVIREECIPIYQGRVDKSLFRSSFEAYEEAQAA
jgi:hypothetical protein